MEVKQGCILFVNCEKNPQITVQYKNSNITSLQDEVSDAARQQFIHDWEMELYRANAKRGQGLNKLRTYKPFTHEYGTDSHMLIKCIRLVRGVRWSVSDVGLR